MRIMSKTNIPIVFPRRRLLILSCAIFSLSFLNVACQSSISVLENNSAEILSDRQVSYQENSISLNRVELEQPLYLEITTSNDTQLIGNIVLEDKAIASLENNLKLDLSTLLKSGSNTIVIVGTYQPQSNFITVKLQGQNTQSTSSTGGNGKIRQKLTIDVL